MTHAARCTLSWVLPSLLAVLPGTVHALGTRYVSGSLKVTVTPQMAADGSMIMDIKAADLLPVLETEQRPNSNMGFKLQRTLEAGPNEPGCYMVGVPTFFGLDDIADSAAADPCTPPTGGDGAVNADDVICSWWTSRQGGMAVSRRDDAREAWDVRAAYLDQATGQIVFTGAWTAPLNANEGYVVQVSAPPSGSVANPIVIVGSHDPSRPCRPVEVGPSGGSTVVVLNLFYHVMYRSSNEILCGLLDVDWTDANGDGLPDTCPGGIFDNSTGARMTVEGFDPATGALASRSVERDPATGQLRFAGVDFDLVPGDAYLARFAPPHSGTLFCQPHF